MSKTQATKEIAVSKSDTRLMGLWALLDFFGVVEPIAELDNASLPNSRALIPSSGTRRVTVSLNFLGETCLRTNLVTKKALNGLKAGDVVEVVTDNLSSVETIPFMQSSCDFTHLATAHDEQAWRLYLEKRETSEARAAPPRIAGGWIAALLHMLFRRS